MAVTDTGAKKRIRDFIERFKTLEDEAGAVFSPAILKDLLEAEVSKIYAGKKIKVIGAGIQDKSEIDKIFSTAMKEGSLLLVCLDAGAHPHTQRRIEEFLKEGCISVQPRDNWLRVQPVEGFQLLAWVNRQDFNEGSFALSPLFGSRLVLEK